MTDRKIQRARQIGMFDQGFVSICWRHDKLPDRVDEDIFRAPPKSKITGLNHTDIARKLLKNIFESNLLPTVPRNIGAGTLKFHNLGIEKLRGSPNQLIKFRQTYHGISVDGSFITIEISPDRRPISISARLGKPNNVDPIANIAPADVFNSLLENTRTTNVRRAPRLKFFFDIDFQRWRLTYFLDVYRAGNILIQEERDRPRVLGEPLNYIIDAHSGHILCGEDQARAASEWREAQDENGLVIRYGVFRDLESTDIRFSLLDTNRQIATYDLQFQTTENPSLAEIYEPPPSEGLVLYLNCIKFLDYFQDELGVKFLQHFSGSVNSDDHWVWTAVNCIMQGLSGNTATESAFAVNNGIIFFGQEKDQNGVLTSWAHYPSTVAHEIVHYVFRSRHIISALNTELLALEESYCDLIAAIISNQRKVGGSWRPMDPDRSRWNWYINLGPSKKRSISKPTVTGGLTHKNQILAHHNRYAWSGIPSKAIYNVFTSRKDGAYLFDTLGFVLVLLRAITKLSASSGFVVNLMCLEAAIHEVYRGDPQNLIDARLAALESAFIDVGIIIGDDID